MRHRADFDPSRDPWEAHQGGASAVDWDIPSISYQRDTSYDDFENIMQWDDSGALEALALAETRQRAMEQGLPWRSFLPRSGLYLAHIDWEQRETWDLPDSADSLAAMEEKRRNSSGGSSYGKWKNQDARHRSNEFRAYDRSQEFKTEGLVQRSPVLWGDAPPVPTGWGDAPPVPTGWGDAPPVSTGWGDAPPVPTGWGDAPPVPTGWGDAPSVPTGWSDAPPVPTGWSDAPPVPTGCGDAPIVPTGWGDVPVAKSPPPSTAGCWTDGSSQGLPGGCRYEAPHSSWGEKCDVDQRRSRQKTVRDNGNDVRDRGNAKPRSCNVWKQKWQPVSNFSHGRGVHS